MAKHNNEPRGVVDFKVLNNICLQQTHHTPAPFRMACSIPTVQLLMTADAWNNYHSVAIHADDVHYFIFITEWGRYRYKSGPQGWIARGDAYTHRYDDITMNIENHKKIVDDSILPVNFSHW